MQPRATKCKRNATAACRPRWPTRHDKYDYKTLPGFAIILCAKGDSPLKPLRPTDAGTGQELAGKPHRDALTGAADGKTEEIQGGADRAVHVPPGRFRGGSAALEDRPVEHEAGRVPA